MTTTTAQTIIEQIGGNQFMAMTGASCFAWDEPKQTLSFRIMKNSKRINGITIQLNCKDLYNIKFLNITALKTTVIAEYDDMYSDMLRGTFESITGLRTSLTTVYS